MLEMWAGDTQYGSLDGVMYVPWTGPGTRFDLAEDSVSLVRRLVFRKHLGRCAL